MIVRTEYRLNLSTDSLCRLAFDLMGTLNEMPEVPEWAVVIGTDADPVDTTRTLVLEIVDPGDGVLALIEQAHTTLRSATRSRSTR